MSVKTVQAIINGSTYNLTYNTSSGKYEATITAPSTSSYKQTGGYFNVQVKATDDAGNTTTVDSTDATVGNSLKLVVKETVAPAIAITSPTEGAKLTNSQPTIEWTVTDADSGVNADTISIIVDSGAKVTSGITKTPITNGYKCSYAIPTALDDGSHIIKIDAKDNDGNSATQRTVSFTVDTVPPELNISTPTNNLITNVQKITLAGTTNDATSSPVTLVYSLNGGSDIAISVGADGSFSTDVTLIGGSNTIVVTATDGAGKSSTVSRTVTYDTQAPTITAVNISPNPVNAGSVFTISVTVSD